MVSRPLLPPLSPFPCSLIHSHTTFPPRSHSSAYRLVSLCQNVSSRDITWGLQGMWSQVLIPSCSACLGLELGSRELTGCVSTGLQGLRWQKQRARETTRPDHCRTSLQREAGADWRSTSNVPAPNQQLRWSEDTSPPPSQAAGLLSKAPFLFPPKKEKVFPCLQNCFLL